MSTIPHSPEQFVHVNGLDLCYDTIGDPSAPPLLLIAGLGMQLTGWGDDFCDDLAARGFWVIRYDNRDVGRSSKLDAAGVPTFPDIRALGPLDLLKWLGSGELRQSAYTLADVADDAAGLLEALGIASAHVVGVSMGGMIAQELAIRHPQRVRTLISIMSATGDFGLPLPKKEALMVLLGAPVSSREEAIEQAVRTWPILNGTALPMDEGRIRESAARDYDRCHYPAGVARHLAAVLASPGRAAALKKVKLPALVIHGEDDPLVPLAWGRKTAKSIPGAKLVTIPGMGHGMPRQVQPQIIEAIAEIAMPC